MYSKGIVFVALRGDDKIFLFDEKGDKLEQKLSFKVGECPRHIAVTDYGVIYVSCQKQGKVHRYLMKDEKILQIGELNIPNASCVAILK